MNKHTLAIGWLFWQAIQCAYETDQVARKLGFIIEKKSEKPINA